MLANQELEGAKVPRKAKVILDRLLQSKQMTPDGMDWLLLATDPNHDSALRLAGYPDLSTVGSIVQTYTTTASFAAPSGTTVPFDVHFPFIPVSVPLMTPVDPTPTPLHSTVMTPDGTMSSAAGLVPLYSGWNAIVNSSPSTQDWYTAGASATLSSSSALALPAKFCSGHYRLIGGSLEVNNTSAQLYKGGGITAFCAPSGVEKGVAKTRSDPAVPGTHWYVSTPTDWITLPPTSQAEAALYPSSRTWAAEDGVYAVLRQTDIENPYNTLSPSDVSLKKAYDNTTVQADLAAGVARNVWTTIGTGLTQPPTYIYGAGAANAHALPFECSGAIFTGLNPNSTLQATVKYFVERIPSTSEPDLLSLTQRSPAYDGMALEIYSRCLAELPVGVPVGENPLGEWFTSILDTISGVAPKIGNFVSSVGSAISSVGQKPKQLSVQPTHVNMMPKQQKQQGNQKQSQSKSAKKRRKKKAKAAGKS